MFWNKRKKLQKLADSGLLEKRIQRAAESILENEALLEGMETEAARTLLDWAASLARTVVMQTVALADGEAEEASYPGMRAIRQLMRQASRWTIDFSSLDEAGHKNMLEQILTNVTALYGNKIRATSDMDKSAFLSTPFTTPQNWITALRSFLEKPVSDNNTGGNNA
jgi:hypothetical protein